jgi:heptosyltransferase-2
MKFIDSQDECNIVWVNTGFLGDIVINTAAIAAVQKKWPLARQFLVSTPLGCSAIGCLAELHGTAAFHKNSKARLTPFRDVKRALDELLAAKGVNGRTVVLSPHRSLRSILLCRYLGFPFITYRESSFSSLATEAVARVALLHEAHRIALLLEPLGMTRAEIMAARPKLPPGELKGDRPWQQRLKDHQGKVILIAASSQWGTKRWPQESFAELMGRLRHIPDVLIVLLGSSAERGYINEIEKGTGGLPQLLNVAGETTLDDLRAIFAKADLVISNDSSPVHYASAFNVPTLAIFGATVPQMGFAPLADHSVSLGRDGLACRPCSLHGPEVCPLGHFKCMKTLTPDEVWQCCAKMLELDADM